MAAKSSFHLGRSTVWFLYCLGLSIIMWLFTVMSKQHNTTIPIAMNYSLEDGKITTFQLPDHLNLSVTATGWKLLRALFVEHNFTLPVSKSAENNIFYTNQNTYLFAQELPVGFVITKIQPDSLILNAEDIMQKFVPVVLEMQLEFDKDYHIVETQLLPDRVLIIGPKSQVDQIEFWSTAILKRKNVDGTIKGSVPLYHSKDENIQLSAIAVQFKIEVDQFVTQQYSLPLESSILNQKKLGIKQALRTDSILVECAVPKNKIDSISNTSFAAIITDVIDSIPQILLKEYPPYIKNMRTIFYQNGDAN